MPAGNPKTCTKCGETKPLDLFAKQGDGFNAWCKECHRAHARAHYYANVEESRRKARERVARAYAEDPEPRKAASRRWYANNREQASATQARWAEVNREKVKAIKRRYWLANKHVTREAVRRRRARLRGNETKPYSEREIYDRDQGRCVHCKAELPYEPRRGWNLDHIVPVALGGPDTPANVQLSCPTCNKRKSIRLEGQIHFGV